MKGFSNIFLQWKIISTCLIKLTLYLNVKIWNAKRFRISAWKKIEYQHSLPICDKRQTFYFPKAQVRIYYFSIILILCSQFFVNWTCCWALQYVSLGHSFELWALDHASSYIQTSTIRGSMAAALTGTFQIVLSGRHILLIFMLYIFHETVLNGPILYK